jgi:hypothetical protein
MAIGTTIRRLLRRMLLWLAAMLDDEPAPERVMGGGPPADWLARVRRGAPQLLEHSSPEATHVAASPPPPPQLRRTPSRAVTMTPAKPRRIRTVIEEELVARSGATPQPALRASSSPRAEREAIGEEEVVRLSAVAEGAAPHVAGGKQEPTRQTQPRRRLVLPDEQHALLGRRHPILESPSPRLRGNGGLQRSEGPEEGRREALLPTANCQPPTAVAETATGQPAWTPAFPWPDLPRSSPTPYPPTPILENTWPDLPPFEGEAVESLDDADRLRRIADEQRRNAWSA